MRFGILSFGVINCAMAPFCGGCDVGGSSTDVSSGEHADAQEGEDKGTLSEDAHTTDTGEPETQDDTSVVPDSGSSDVGEYDVGASDTGISDSGIVDAGHADTGAQDSGQRDTGEATDGGTQDVEIVPDGGFDRCVPIDGYCAPFGDGCKLGYTPIEFFCEKDGKQGICCIPA